MSTPVRVAAFLVSLVVAFGLALGVGNAVDPIGVQAGDADEHTAGHTAGHREAPSRSDASLPGGLMVTEAGYTLRAQPQAAAGRNIPFSFTVTTPPATRSPSTTWSTRSSCT